MIGYVAYGLRIRSDIDLSGLPETNESPDVTIRLANVADVRLESPGLTSGSWTSQDEVLVFWKDAGAFRIRGGRFMDVDPAPGVDVGDLRPLILGQLMAVVLHQRGRLVLHASAVALDGEVVVFLGDSGAGKSTTAAGMLRRGHSLMSDDILAIGFDDSGAPLALPAFPQVRLLPEAVLRLGIDPSSLERPSTMDGKRVLRPEVPPPHPLPVRRIYALTNRHPEVRSMPFQESVVACIRHSFCTEILGADDRAPHFRHCSDLAARVSFRELPNRTAFDSPQELVRFVENDLSEVRSASVQLGPVRAADSVA